MLRCSRRGNPFPAELALAAAVLIGCGTSANPETTKEDDAGQDAGAAPMKDAAVGSDSADVGTVTVGPPMLLTEPGQGMTPIYTFVSSAKKTIDMTMYELEDTTMTGLLISAESKGVKVRVILDQNLEEHTNLTAYDALSAGNVDVHWANPTYAASHQKTITVDGATSAVMTLNLATEYYATTRDFAVLTTDAADVAAIESVFGDDFTNAAVTPPLGDDLVWSPTNSYAALVALLNDAKTSLLVENEEMSDSDIISALSGAAARGVKVQVVMTASHSWDAAFASLTSGGVSVSTYAPNAPLYIHAKVILADYGLSGASVFIGSENFSDASLTRNRELGVILKDAAVLDSIHTTLTSDFAGATPY